VKARFLSAILLVSLNAFAQIGVRAPSHPTRVHRGFSNFLPWFYGDSGYDAYAPPAPSVVMIEQPPLYVAVPMAPVAPPKAEMHEYSHPAAQDGEETFALVLKDGSVLSAVAVTSQAGGLYYVDPDGAHRLVKLDALDREATMKMNRERHLQLQIPAEK